MREYSVYVMSSFSGAMYFGVTNDLERRVAEHKSGSISGFAAKYKATPLVYYEATSDVHAALAREKQLKVWTRAKKAALIKNANPLW
jgi:putative endonuclease